MNAEHSIPPLRDLPPGRLAERERHLLAEITREQRSRLSPLAWPLSRLRLAVLVSLAACCAGAVAAALLIASGGTTEGNRSPFLVQATHPPTWSAATAGPNWGFNTQACSSTIELFFGCHGILTLPALSAPIAAAGQTATAPAAPARPTTSTTKIIGGTAAERMLLRSIVAGMQATSIEKITIIPNEKGVALRMTATDASMRSLWEESLVAAAFRDRAKAAGNEVTVSLVNGESSGVIPPGPAKALTSAKAGDAKAAKTRFVNAAAKIGASFAAMSIYQPDGIAVAATLKANEPAVFLVKKMPVFLAALGDRWRDYDGTYLRLVDDSGATVWETSSAGRISEGSVGSREDLAGCSPVANWGPTLPPCPAK